MSSKKNREGKSRKGLTKTEVILKNKSQKRQNLRTSLHKIYTSVNLETVGCDISVCHCECCKVAMPQMNYCEFVQIITDAWSVFSSEEKINLICKSVEYFFRNEYEKWGIDSLIKPCQFIDEHGKCKIYHNRPLSCYLYGLWPEDEYERRVDLFEEAYAEYGLSREDLPLHTQCKMIRRADGSKEVPLEDIDKLFASLDKLDKSIGTFSDLQIKEKENYRTLHDWLLLKIFGEQWLTMLTTFMMSASREQMEDQIEQLRTAIKESLHIETLDIKDKL